jgi:MFS family permease
MLFLRLRGSLADRFSNKSVLKVAGPLFILTTALWPFTTMPEKYFLTIPIIIVIHALTGMSTAGVTLCTGNIALKLAPRGKATAYLAVSALVSGMTAATAPIMGGLSATGLAGERLSLTIRWLSDEAPRWRLPAFELAGLDFLFIISFLIGFHAIYRLAKVQEQGEVEEAVVLNELRSAVRKGVRNLSNVAGLRDLFYFPYGSLRNLMNNS